MINGQFRTAAVLYCVLAVLAFVVLAAATSNGRKDEGVSPSFDVTAGDHIQVPPPPFSEDIFPCTECHDDEEPDTDRRELAAHENIILRHDEENRWCLDCHDALNRDVLRLASGAPVPFEESYRLCGQCHGEKLRDWKAGIHGKRIGLWDGQKTYLLCAHCHDPHRPAFRKLPPLPSPEPPDELRASLKRPYLGSPAVILDNRITPPRADSDDEVTAGLDDDAAPDSADQTKTGEDH